MARLADGGGGGLAGAKNDEGARTVALIQSSHYK